MAQQPEKSVDKWIKIGTFPNHSAQVLKITNNQLICVQPAKAWGIYKYNIHLNEWTQFIKYSSLFNQDIGSVGFNKENQTLYIHGRSIDDQVSVQMTTINLQTNEFKTYSNIPQNGVYCSLINVDGTMHLIGGDRNSKHLVWNHETESFETIYDFIEYDEINIASSIYIPCKQQIVLIGGHDLSRMIRYPSIYSSNTKQWTKMKEIELKMNELSVALSSDERYIVMAGGWDENVENSDNIFVLDMNDDEIVLKQSSVCLPYKGVCNIVITGGRAKDEILVIGSVKNMLNTMINVEMPPLEIMKLITCFYSEGTLHCFPFNSEDNEHYVISMKHILNTL